MHSLNGFLKTLKSDSHYGSLILRTESEHHCGLVGIGVGQCKHIIKSATTKFSCEKFAVTTYSCTALMCLHKLSLCFISLLHLWSSSISSSLSSLSSVTPCFTIRHWNFWCFSSLKTKRFFPERYKGLKDGVIYS